MIKAFAFSEKKQFNGKIFYEKYKTAEFLKDKSNISKILLQFDELKHAVDSMAPDTKLVIEGMFLDQKVPLVIKKSTSINENDVDYEEFTLRRLSGLVAMHVWNYRRANQPVYAKEPESLGIFWNDNANDRSLYVSAIPGAEYFEEFDYYPFICALRKYQPKKISGDELVHIATITLPPSGEPMAVRARRNYEYCKTLSQRFMPQFDLAQVIQTAPQAVKTFFLHMK